MQFLDEISRSFASCRNETCFFFFFYNNWMNLYGRTRQRTRIEKLKNEQQLASLYRECAVKDFKTFEVRLMGTCAFATCRFRHA